MKRRLDTSLFILETAPLRLLLAPANRFSRRALNGVISGAMASVLNWMLRLKTAKDFDVSGIADGTVLDAVAGTANNAKQMLDFNDEGMLPGRIRTPYQAVDPVFPGTNLDICIDARPRWTCTQGQDSPALLLGSTKAPVTIRRLLFARQDSNDTCPITLPQKGKFTNLANCSNSSGRCGWVTVTTLTRLVFANRAKKTRQAVIGSKDDSVQCYLADGTHRQPFRRLAAGDRDHHGLLIGIMWALQESGMHPVNKRILKVH